MPSTLDRILSTLGGEPEHPDLPAYDPYMQAFHEAFTPELEKAIARYRTIKNARILDLACGDGFYTSLFAKHMTNGEIVGVDHSAGYLAKAEANFADKTHGPTISFVEADAYHTPFEEESFDMVWCAQSMISLKHPVEALQEMRRVLKPRGVLAVLETDEYHHILLPWPVELELAIQKAIRAASFRRYGSSGKLAQSRKIRAMIQEAGLTPTRKSTIACDRQVPFDEATRSFLLEHFAYLRKLLYADLSPADALSFDRFTAPDGDDSLLTRADGEMTCLATIFHAKK